MAACCQDECDVEWLQRDVAQCVSVCVMWCVSVSRVACRRVVSQRGGVLSGRV